MVHGYPPPTGNPDGSTLTSGFSIDRPMFSDSTTVTSGESPAPLGGNYRQGFAAMPQGEYSLIEKTRSSESNASTYI